MKRTTTGDSSDIEEKFKKLLDDVKVALPWETAEQIIGGLERTWEKPPLEQLELIEQRTTGLRDARLLIFFPEPVDMARYVSLIQKAPKGAPDAHPQNKLRRPFLALLYMVHVRSWPLMRDFIRAGGFCALADLFDDENLHMRAQAVDTFMQLTSPDAHDWFAEPILEPAVHQRPHAPGWRGEVCL